MNFKLSENGDLVLFASNGDPLLRLQKAGLILGVSSGRHLGDSRAEALSPEAIEAIREWCEGNRA